MVMHCHHLLRSLILSISLYHLVLSQYYVSSKDFLLFFSLAVVCNYIQKCKYEIIKSSVQIIVFRTLHYT